MQVSVNGEQWQFPAASTVADVVAAVGTPSQGIAVALNDELVRRGSWDEVTVHDGARVDVFTAVQGG